MTAAERSILGASGWAYPAGHYPSGQLGIAHGHKPHVADRERRLV